MDKITILVAEDESVTAMYTREVLLRRGDCFVRVTTSGESAVASVRDEKPDIVLMDIALSGSMNGIDAAREIIESSGVPVLFVTALQDDDLLSKARDVSPYPVLQKPVKPPRLNTIINRIVAHLHQM